MQIFHISSIVIGSLRCLITLPLSRDDLFHRKLGEQWQEGWGKILVVLRYKSCDVLVMKEGLAAIDLNGAKWIPGVYGNPTAIVHKCIESYTVVIVTIGTSV